MSTKTATNATMATSQGPSRPKEMLPPSAKTSARGALASESIGPWNLRGAVGATAPLPDGPTVSVALEPLPRLTHLAIERRLARWPARYRHSWRSCRRRRRLVRSFGRRALRGRARRARLEDLVGVQKLLPEVV